MIIGCREANPHVPKFEVTCASSVRVDTLVDLSLSTTRTTIEFYDFNKLVAIYPTSCIVRQLK